MCRSSHKLVCRPQGLFLAERMNAKCTKSQLHQAEFGRAQALDNYVLVCTSMTAHAAIPSTFLVCTILAFLCVQVCFCVYLF